MTVFPKNNLPTGSLNWSREVEKAVTNLETTFKSAEVNNVTRDAQLQNSYKRLDAALTQLTTTTAAADQAQTDALTAVSTANTANTNALNALQDIIDLGSPNGPSINATNITGGTITGITVQTAASGTRSKLSGSNIEFFSSLYNSGASRVGYIQGDDGGSAGVYIISDQGAIALDAVDITLSGDSTVTGELSVGGSLGVTGGLTVGGAFSPGSISTGSITGSSLNVGSGAIDGGDISGATIEATGPFIGPSCSIGTVAGGGLSITGNSDLQGRIISAGTYNAVASSTANVLINTNNYFQRTTSSRRYKSDIQDIDYGMTGLELRPRTWVDKAAYEENGNSTEGLTRITGFIAEEIHDLGLTELVQYNEDGLPEAVNYDRMLVAIMPILKQQQATIEALEARLSALEDRV